MRISNGNGISQGLLVSRYGWMFGEIAIIFLLFFLQGAWPAPEVNETHYLGKATHFWNPEWIRGDFFLDSADSHLIFYLTCGWMTRFLSLSAVAWIGRILTWLLMAWSWRKLSVALIPRAGWSIVTAALFALGNERFQMAGEWFLGGFEAKGFAFVLIFLGLESLVRNRWNRSWLYFGAAASFHVVLGGWAIVAAGFAWLFLASKTYFSAEGDVIHRPSFRAMLPGLLGGFLLALPGLIPALALSWSCDRETLRHANEIYVFERLRHHLDLFQIRYDFLGRFAFLVLFYLILCRQLKYLLLSSGNRTGTGVTERGPLALLHVFVAGTLAIFGLGILISFVGCVNPTWAAGILRFYWFRLADVVVPLGVAFLWVDWIRLRLAMKSIWGRIGAVVVFFLVVFHFGGFVSVRIHPSNSRADRLENVAAWQDACRYIRENTPSDARFFTPRLGQTFKWYAQRAEVATWKDVPQDARAIVAWWSRIQDIFATGNTLPEYRWRENVTDLPPDQMKLLAKKYGANYAIAPAKTLVPGLKIEYNNEGYVVYGDLLKDR